MSKDVRNVDIKALQTRHDWEFRTKHELALALCQRVMRTLRAMGSEAGFVVVFDGAYAGPIVGPPLDRRRGNGEKQDSS